MRVTTTVAAGQMPSAPRGGARGEGNHLGDEVDRLTACAARRWCATSTEVPGVAELGPARSRWRQWRNARRLDGMIRSVCRLAGRAPVEALETDPERIRWQAEIKAEVASFGEDCLGWPRSWRESPLGDGIAGASETFVHRIRQTTGRCGIELADEDLFQALRNVWIANGLQVLLGRPVATTPAVFAYSALYPLTDNFLDDPEVTPEEKAAFARRFGRRLAGELPVPASPREAAVFEMVAEIEGELPRSRYPRVFESLLAIHRAQVESLRQQSGARLLDDAELLRVSCEKGGTSVLADGFVVAGDLSADEMAFLFDYGVALQLLDDVQDATDDRAAGHRTLFSVAAERAGRPGGEPLDALVGRLARFTADVLRAGDRFDTADWGVTLGLIRQSCPLLLLQAVAEQRDLFSPGFVRRLERHFPVRFRALPRLGRRARRRWRRTERLLRRRGWDGRLDGSFPDPGGIDVRA